MGITKEAMNKAEELGIIPERLEVLDKQLNYFIEQGQRQAIIFKGMKKGVIFFEGTYGINTKEYGLKLDTIFNVCSITKPIVATLILCLQEDGIVDVSERVCRYLPEFTGGGKENVCIWHLMTHSSGLDDQEIWDFLNEYIKNELGIEVPNNECSHEEFEEFSTKVAEKMGVDRSIEGRMGDVEYLISLKFKMKRKPRVNMVYFNYGYQRLADIITAVTGESLDEYASRKLFVPLGMKDTAWRMPKDKWHRIIGRIDTAVSAEWFNCKENYVSESGAGGIKTTVDDMMSFTQMILNEGKLNNVRVLSKASIDQMFINHNKGVSCDLGEEYSGWSLGWNLHGNKKDSDGILRSEKCIDHTGYGGTKIFVDPEHDLTMAFFAAETVHFEKPEFININGRVLNLVMAAMED
ncbi:penicillin-binding protein 4* [Clostridium puniceum]|uniref:Penicillin-binding protein 4 n=1 Tax=Clostridium puniceum TaxID=29367 RepID=A0A1S8TEB1_9CLOT|nr:serine hydrolase domain-containing protein [Clostridium puniceum]OOM75954.1 penicillin-binding protein 4* [Clostridium puniceum]